jgi:sugar transferase (PEP-CTERM/EpsH1 system associated)
MSAVSGLDILFLAHRVPYPLDKGERIRAYHEIAALAAVGHRVHLVALCDERRPPASVGPLREWCATVDVVPLRILTRRWQTARALLRGEPLSCGHFDSPAARRIVATRLIGKRIDLVVAFSSTMLQYVPREWRHRTIVDVVDSDAEKWLDYSRASRGIAAAVYRLEARRLRAYEDALVGSCAASVVISDREASAFGSERRPQVITAAVDVRRFVAAEPARNSSAPPRIVFLGAMGYRPNADAVCYFATLVLPRIQEVYPRAEFVIVGHGPTRRVRRLARRTGVVVTGRVPDVRPFLWSADVCVAPLAIARGVQNKVLESIAAGCPVVTSSTAIAGLKLVDGEHVLVSDSPERFADAVLRLLGDPADARAMADRARAFVARVYSLDRLRTEFTRLVADCSRSAQDLTRSSTISVASTDAAACAR